MSRRRRRTTLLLLAQVGTPKQAQAPETTELHQHVFLYPPPAEVEAAMIQTDDPVVAAVEAAAYRLLADRERAVRGSMEGP